MLTVGCWAAGQLAGRKGAVVANTNLVKIANHNGLKYYMLPPLPRGVRGPGRGLSWVCR